MSAAGNWWTIATSALGQVVAEWIVLAQEDAMTAEREFAATPPNYPATCFHAQQAIEKLIKAVLAQHGVVAKKIHDLVALGAELSNLHPSWTWPATELRTLSLGAVEYRYPGQRANRQEAQAALAICQRVWPTLAALL